MIVGITHEADGRARVSRTVTIKVATGIAPEGEKGYPKALDHFVFLRKTQVGKEIKWVVDKPLTEHYGSNPREIWITLLGDDPEGLFRTEYAAYAKRGRWCHGDGVKAERRDIGTAAKPAWGEFKVFQGPCAEGGCPLVESGECSPSGDLYFMLSEFPTLGSICRLHTGSYQSIRQIYSALTDIRNITGGRLTGVQVKLFMHPDKSAWTSGDGQRKTGTKWVLGLELAAADLASLKGKMLEAAQAFQSIRLQLGEGSLVIDEDDAERGRELTPEFYPTVANAGEAKPEGKILPAAQASEHDEAVALMKKHGLTDAMIEQRLEMYRDRMPELLQKIRAYEVTRNAPTADAAPQTATSQPAKPAEAPTPRSGAASPSAGNVAAKPGPAPSLFVDASDTEPPAGNSAEEMPDFIVNPEKVVATAKGRGSKPAGKRPLF